jgi:tripartite-type tricarboxylate transporter receptor subunit TctC
VAAAIAGETSMIVADLATGSAGLQSDRIRPLAVTSMTRSKKYPELPTLNESSVTGYEVNTWMGFFTPARTPDAVANQIEAAIKEVLTLPDVRARLEQTGMEMRSGTAEELHQLLASGIAKWSKLVKERNIIIDQ